MKALHATARGPPRPPVPLSVRLPARTAFPELVAPFVRLFVREDRSPPGLTPKKRAAPREGCRAFR